MDWHGASSANTSRWHLGPPLAVASFRTFASNQLRWRSRSPGLAKGGARSARTLGAVFLPDDVARWNAALPFEVARIKEKMQSLRAHARLRAFRASAVWFELWSLLISRRAMETMVNAVPNAGMRCEAQLWVYLARPCHAIKTRTRRRANDDRQAGRQACKRKLTK